MPKAPSPPSTGSGPAASKATTPRPRPKRILSTPSAWKKAQPKPDSPHVHFHEGGQVIANKDSQRIEELEIPWPLLWAQHARSLGYDPTLFTLHTMGGKTIQILEQIDGDTFKVVA